MVNLKELPAYYVGRYGVARVAEVVEKSPGLVSMWVKRDKFPLHMLQRLVEFDPAPIATTPLYTNPPEGTKLVILMPCNGKPEPETIETLMRMYDPKEMAFKRVAFNSLSVARNCLASYFLAGPWEWAFWLDADNPVPCGDATLFKSLCNTPAMPDAFAGVHTIFRLLYHKRKIVSGVYVGRKAGAPPQFGGGDTEHMRAKVRRGPRAEIAEVPWVGFGCVLTHRSVFEDIITTQGNEIRHNSDALRQRFGYEYSFFDPTTKETPGDDIPWCARAIRAGHKPCVDFAVFAGHVGSKVFNYSDL